MVLMFETLPNKRTIQSEGENIPHISNHTYVYKKSLFSFNTTSTQNQCPTTVFVYENLYHH